FALASGICPGRRRSSGLQRNYRWQALKYEKRPEAGGLARAALRASIRPEVFEAVRRKLGISNCMGGVLVPEILLNRSCVPPIVRQLVTRRVSEHMRVNRKRETGRNAGAAHHFAHRRVCHRPATLTHENVWGCRVLARQTPQSAQFRTAQRMRARN